MRIFLCLAAALLVVGCSKEASQERSMERARGFFEAGEYEKAKLEYLSVVQKNRRNAEAISRLGLIWSLQGSPLQAYSYMRRASEMGKLPDDLRPRLLSALVETGRLEEAQREAREILKRNPAQADALLLLADTARTKEQVAAVMQEFEALPSRETAGYQAAMVPLLLRSNRLLEAEEAGAKALALDPKLVTAHLASVALRQADMDEPGVEDALRTASELAPARSVSRLRFANFMKEKGALEEVRAQAAAVLKVAPDYIPALMLSAELAKDAKAYDETEAALQKVFAIDSTNPGARLLQADMLLARKDAPAAVAVLQRLDQMFEQAPNIRVKLARAHFEAGQLSEAEDLLNKLLVKKPEFTEASLLLALVHLRQDNPAAVVPAMQEVLEREPELEAAAFNLVLALEAQRRFGEAVTVMQGLAERNPANPVFRIRLGQLLTAAGEFAQARTVLEQLAAGSPNIEDFSPLLLDIDLREGRLDEALQRASSWRERQPASVPAWFAEASVHILKQQWEQAEVALKKVLELDSGHIQALEQLSRLYATTNRLPDAVRAMEQRVQLAAGDASGLNLLALLRSQQGEYSKAAEAYEKILASQAEPQVMTLNNLAVLYAEHLGKIDKAYELAQQARALRPSTGAAATDAARQEAAAIADTLGRILYLKGRFPEAMPLADEAMTLLSSDPEVQAHFGLAAAAMGRNDEAKTALAKALEAQVDFPAKAEWRQRLAMLTGDAAAPQTSAELAALVRQAPSDPLLQSRLAEAFEKENKWAEAAAAYGAALKLNPGLAAVALKLAELHAGPLKDPDKAIGFAKTAWELAPNDAAVAGVLGGLAYRSGEYQWSYDLLSEAARTGTKQSRVLLDLGRAAYSLGRVAEARTAVQQALQAAPEAEVAAEGRLFLDLTAAPAPAEAVAQEVLARDERSVPALMIVGEARLKAGDTAAAVAAWQKVLDLHPDFAPARKSLSMVLLKEPATRARAYELAVKAHESLPDDPDLTETLAILVHHRKDHRYAVELFDEAARIRPSGPAALYYRGASQLALGETEAGRASLTQAVDGGLTGPEAEEAARLLESGKQ